MIKRATRRLVHVSKDKIKTGIAVTAGTLVRSAQSPDEAYGDLFRDVQKKNILGDGKTFADMIPKKRAQAIRQEYTLAKQDPDFDLRDFVSRHFYEFSGRLTNGDYEPQHDTPILEHISELWNELERRNRKTRGSLLPLPYKYIVPGGRFSEQFYWDSYFIMLGLAAENRWDNIDDMMKNYAFMIRKWGFIPTANRSYFLSRSQPPYFALMVQLLASNKGRHVYAEYLPYLLAEYRWWTRGRSKLAKQEHKAYARLVQMPDGSLMNRYYDNRRAPRPESLREDIETAEDAEGREADRVFLHLRAGAESGWDFSSRWFRDPDDITTIHTVDIVPVDLNCLLYELEKTIGATYTALKNPLLARRFNNLALRRAAAINKYCWNEQTQTFGDYNFHLGASTTSIHAAMVYPLYVGIASHEQAEKVAECLQKNLLENGGIMATTVDNGQQWDAPNGWAPLNWTAIIALRNYGFDELADEIKSRWMHSAETVYARDKKLIEKYNVASDSRVGGGGEYPLQDGFGWTNGVYVALAKNFKP